MLRELFKPVEDFAEKELNEARKSAPRISPMYPKAQVLLRALFAASNVRTAVEILTVFGYKYSFVLFFSMVFLHLVSPTFCLDDVLDAFLHVSRLEIPVVGWANRPVLTGPPSPSAGPPSPYAATFDTSSAALRDAERKRLTFPFPPFSHRKTFLNELLVSPLPDHHFLTHKERFLPQLENIARVKFGSYLTFCAILAGEGKEAHAFSWRALALFVRGFVWASSPSRGNSFGSFIATYLDIPTTTDISDSWREAYHAYHSSPHAPSFFFDRDLFVEPAVSHLEQLDETMRAEQRLLEAVLDAVIERDNIKRMLKEWKVEAIRVGGEEFRTGGVRSWSRTRWR
ncbi:hypothetical protein JCM8547_008117 [Rhodosporidiobolus lusitaniae]